MSARRTLRARGLVALLAASLAMSGTGLPCLLACAAQAGESHDQAAPCHGDDAAHHEPGADDVLCGSDPAPAILAATDASAPLFALGIVVPVALTFQGAPRTSARFTHVALPDRSPPVSTGSVVLRI